MSDATETTLDEAVSRGMTALVLGYTADALDNEGEGTADAIMAMTAETQLAVEVVAGILAAAVLLAAAAEMDPANLRAVAAAYEDEAVATDAADDTER